MWSVLLVTIVDCLFICLPLVDGLWNYGLCVNGCLICGVLGLVTWCGFSVGLLLFVVLVLWLLIVLF